MKFIPPLKQLFTCFTFLEQGIHWNYTTILNIIFLVLAAGLVIRFVRTGGISMLKMMNTLEHQMDHHNMEDYDMSQQDTGHHEMGQHHMEQHEVGHHEMPQ